MANDNRQRHTNRFWKQKYCTNTHAQAHDRMFFLLFFNRDESTIIHSTETVWCRHDTVQLLPAPTKINFLIIYLVLGSTLSNTHKFSLSVTQNECENQIAQQFTTKLAKFAARRVCLIK